MTDKQIIDGIDVSGCTRYCADNGKCTAFKSQYLCSERNNCYTKRILKKNKTINILKEKLQRKEQECEELKHEVELMMDCASCKVDEYKQTLAEIKEIAECMHDLWINKTTYTDMDNLVKHLLECELNRIRYKLDEISECEVEDD